MTWSRPLQVFLFPDQLSRQVVPSPPLAECPGHIRLEDRRRGDVYLLTLSMHDAVPCEIVKAMAFIYHFILRPNTGLAYSRCSICMIETSVRCMLLSKLKSQLCFAI